jgi:chromate transporter
MSGKGRIAKARRLAELFGSFFTVSLVTVGGGIAMTALIVDFVVRKKGWLPEAEMIDCIALSQSLPGAFVLNVATYVGKRTAGFAGSVAAVFGTITPAFAVIILVMLFIGRLDGAAWLDGALDGARAAAAALVIAACLRIGGSAVKKAADWILAAASFAAVAFFGLSALLAIAGGAAAGLVLGAARGRRAKR